MAVLMDTQISTPLTEEGLSNYLETLFYKVFGENIHHFSMPDTTVTRGFLNAMLLSQIVS